MTLTQLLSSAVEPAGRTRGLVLDDGGFAAFYQAQFGDCMTQQCISFAPRAYVIPCKKRSGADHLKEDGAWKASDLTLNLK